MRAFFLWIHKWLGLLSTIFLVIAALTGSILAFQHELDRWLNPHFFTLESGKSEKRLSVGEWMERVEERFPGISVGFFRLPRDEASPIIAGARFSPQSEEAKQGYNQLFIDPRDGAVLGARNSLACCSKESIIPFLYKFHYTLFLPQRYGVWLMGGVAILWLVILISGLYISTPNLFKGRFFERYKPMWKIKWGAKRYRWFSDTHRALGLWLLIPLFLLALSSVALNLRHEVFNPVLSLFSTLEPSLGQKLPAYPPKERFKPVVGFEEAIERAQAIMEREGRESKVHVVRYFPRWRSYMIRFDKSNLMGYGLPALFISAQDGSEVARHFPGSGSLGDRFSDLQLPIHSGKVAGLGGRIFIAILGLIITWLGISGLYLWWRKKPFASISLWRLKRQISHQEGVAGER